MAQPILIKNPPTGILKTGYYGFSWTYLFFGWFVPIFRGEPTIALVHAALTLLTVGVWQIVFAFIYNKQYMIRMLTSGWVLDGTKQENARAQVALGIEPPPQREK
jgi:hypothetical protein